MSKFIYLSTAHVYSNPLSGTINEQTPPRNLHPYATSHLAGEQTLLQQTFNKQMSGVVLRLSNVIGAPMNKYVNCWSLLANDLCRQAVSSGKLIIKSNGKQQRDFISMAEICKQIKFFVSIDPLNKIGNIINIGTGISRSVIEFTELIQYRCMKTLGFKPEIQIPFENKKNNQPFDKLLFLSTEKENLGLNISTNLSDEIDNLLKFCKDNF